MTIAWIVLPNGKLNQTLSASLYVAPQLTGSTLAGTPFANWPDTVASSFFTLSFEPNGPTFQVTPTPQYDSALWLQVFGTSAVQPFTFKDNSSRPLWSYPVSRTKAFIDSVYAAVQAGSATDYPSVDPATQGPLAQAIDDLNVGNRQRITTGREFYRQVRMLPVTATWAAAALAEQASLGGLSPNAKVAYLAKRFFDRPASSTTKDDQGNRLPLPRPVVPTFDFHQKLALLADHPFLLRKLGLVLDVQFGDAAVALPSSGVVRAHAFSALGTPIPGSVAPGTHYELVGATGFRAAPVAGSTEVRDGFIPLDDANTYFTSQGEPDQDIHKLVGFATNMELLTRQLTIEAGEVTAPENQTVPARRSAGLYVARNDRAGALQARFSANASIESALNSAAPPDFFADDLLRGYRVDVKTSTSQWLSLHRRQVSYAYGLGTPTPIADVVDEAYLKAHSGTSDGTPGGPPDLYVHEVMFGWEGWSLGAPRPGRRLMPVHATPADAIAAPDDTPNADFPLRAPVKALPGSLMPLRFGYPYSFRMRAVDLAGNSLPPTAPDPATPHATALQVYKRYEPIVPPALVLRFAVTEGESVEHLVIRSGEGLSADGYAAALNSAYADPKFPAKVYRGTSERHVAAPKTSQSVAETHGDFDGAFSATADTQAFFRLGTREEGTFADKRIASLTVSNGFLTGNPNQAAIITPPQVPLDQRRSTDGGSAVSSLTENRGDALAPGEYVVCGAASAVLPYLPDSAAGGMVLFDPAGNAQVLAFSWQGTWPDWAPFRLQLADGPTVTFGPVVTGVATVQLPPATMLTLDYASVPANNRLNHLAYVVDHAVPASQLASGRHWMLTPRRQLVLVHAVPRPLAPPSLAITISRNIDETWVTHVGMLTSHSRSTNHVDLEASWNEVLDVPSKPLPDDGVSSPAIAQTGHAYQVPVAYGQDASLVRLRHDFHDTRHRVVRYTPVAQTRYKEYFPAALVADPAKISLSGTAPGPGSDGTFSILSGSRPIAPRVVSVVPTFRWEASSGLSVRHGGGLRIYLERPWYSTGEGELLGVLLANANGAAPLDRVSRWGRDPLFTDGVAGPLAGAHFVSPKTTAHDLPLADGSGLVDVVGFPVEFNADRRLWFCDVQLDAGGAYFPFISLALARYQPDSVKTVELSTLVRADFGQLVPDRQLGFTFQSQSVQLALTGVVSTNAAESLLPGIPLSAGGQSPVPSTHRIVAYAQERAPGSVGEMGFETVGAEVTFDGSRSMGSSTARWSANLPLPPASNPARERRVVVEEREYYQADPDDRLTIKGQAPIDYRVVYLDTVAVP